MPLSTGSGTGVVPEDLMDTAGALGMEGPAGGGGVKGDGSEKRGWGVPGDKIGDVPGWEPAGKGESEGCGLPESSF